MVETFSQLAFRFLYIPFLATVFGQRAFHSARGYSLVGAEAGRPRLLVRDYGCLTRLLGAPRHECELAVGVLF